MCEHGHTLITFCICGKERATSAANNPVRYLDFLQELISVIVKFKSFWKISLVQCSQSVTWLLSDL